MQGSEPTGAWAALKEIGLCGVDFSSAPSRRKPIMIAEGSLDAQAEGNLRGVVARPQLRWHNLVACSDWHSFASYLRRPGPRLGAFDLPFGLPRDLLCAWGWDHLDHRAISARFAQGDRAGWIAQLKSFCAARPPGQKFAHRACDLPVGSSPSMKWVNPPVVFMYREGFARILEAGWLLPGFDDLAQAFASPSEVRLAVETYPGALARKLIGRLSYKADDALRQTGARREARQKIVDGISSLSGIALHLDAEQQKAVLDDARGDTLDALLCLVIAARCAVRGPPRWGAPLDADPLEGWIAQ